MTIERLLQRLADTQREYHEALVLIQDEAPELFKATRKAHGLSQRAFANLLHVDFSFISKVENGHMRPGKPVLQRLAAYIEEKS